MDGFGTVFIASDAVGEGNGIRQEPVEVYQLLSYQREGEEPDYRYRDEP